MLSNSINYTEVLNWLDWLIFSIVILMTILSVLYGHKLKTRQGHELLDHLIMGRQLTLPLFIATLVATWYGGIFGVTKIAFESGLYNLLTQGIFWYISYIIFALFLVERVTHLKAVTLPDLIGKMFGPMSSKLAGIFNFFNVLPIAYVISLGLFIQSIFGIDFTLSLIIGVLFTCAYSIWGGFRAVVFSDLVQFFVMCLSVFLVIIFSLSNIGGLSFLRANLPSSHWSFTGSGSLAETFVWGFIALSTLVDPNFYQRVFAAKSSDVAKKGILLSTIIWILFDLCTTFGAMYAKASIPEAESTTAYLTYALQILPHGFRGFFIAGILATVLSTLDSYLFLAGTTLSFDLLPKGKNSEVIKHRIGLVLVGFLSILMALIFKGDIKAVWKTLGSYSAACLLVPVLFGYLFPQKIKDYQFVITSTLGVIAVTAWKLIKKTGLWAQIDGLYLGISVTLFSLVIFALINNTKRNIRS